MTYWMAEEAKAKRELAEEAAKLKAEKYLSPDMAEAIQEAIKQHQVDTTTYWLLHKISEQGRKLEGLAPLIGMCTVCKKRPASAEGVDICRSCAEG